MTIKKTLSEKLDKKHERLTFGRALWAYRKGEKMSQKELAKALGISSSSLCDLERGRSVPSVRRAVKIAEKLGQSQKVWVQLTFQDSLKEAGLDYKVSLA